MTDDLKRITEIECNILGRINYCIFKTSYSTNDALSFLVKVTVH